MQSAEEHYDELWQHPLDGSRRRCKQATVALIRARDRAVALECAEHVQDSLVEGLSPEEIVQTLRDEAERLGKGEA